jgi:hypothetical protein
LIASDGDDDKASDRDGEEHNVDPEDNEITSIWRNLFTFSGPNLEESQNCQTGMKIM